MCKTTMLLLKKKRFCYKKKLRVFFLFRKKLLWIELLKSAKKRIN